MAAISADNSVTRAELVRDMAWIEGGEFRMGSDFHYPEEAPAHRVSVDGFFIDPYPVTNRQFAAFVSATGYRTVAERPLSPTEYPGALPHMLKPGSLVFRKTRGPVDLHDISNWWGWKPGAYWRHPEGKGSSVAGGWIILSYRWPSRTQRLTQAGPARSCRPRPNGSLRRAADWLASSLFGAASSPGDRQMANTWQGEFPWQNLAVDGFERTSPVGVFPANGYGLYDMAGNVWEWTVDWFSSRHQAQLSSPCCTPANPRSASMEASCDPAQPQCSIPRKVVKGGSFLCAPNYCRRYRPAARHAQMIDSGMSHIGFRCVLREH